MVFVTGGIRGRWSAVVRARYDNSQYFFVTTYNPRLFVLFNSAAGSGQQGGGLTQPSAQMKACTLLFKRFKSKLKRLTFSMSVFFPRSVASTQAAEWCASPTALRRWWRREGRRTRTPRGPWRSTPSRVRSRTDAKNAKVAKNTIARYDKFFFLGAKRNKKSFAALKNKRNLKPIYIPAS